MGRRFLELGAGLVICGRREAVLAATAAEFEAEFPGRVAWHRCDIREAAAVEAMIDQIWAAAPLTALVNNAAGNFIARSETVSPRGLDTVLGIVLHGAAYVPISPPNSRPAIRSAAPAATPSSPTSPASSSPTPPAILPARRSPSTAANGWAAPASSTSSPASPTPTGRSSHRRSGDSAEIGSAAKDQAAAGTAAAARV
jgi:hypothetical protein